MDQNSRRKFLKTSFGATLFVSTYNPFKNLIDFSKRETKYPDWAELVEYARWCPTVHNLQPHKVKVVSETEAELYYDPARLLPVGDPISIFATVALGIFVENLSVAASKYGVKVEPQSELNPIRMNATEATLFIKLNMVPADQQEELDRELIKKRRTSRLNYDGNPLKQQTLDKIKQQAEQFNHEFFSSSEQEFIDYIVDLNQQTLFEDLGSQAEREELDRLFRYDKTEAETKKDGLWAKCMGFSGSLMKSVFRNHEKWEKGLRKKMLAKHYKASFKGTATLCWFGGKFDNPRDWFTAGRMMARSWLHITSEKAYLQPFGSLITNVGAYQKIKEKFTQPQAGKKIWLIFRAGYSDEPTRSYRLNTEEILIK